MENGPSRAEPLGMTYGRGRSPRFSPSNGIDCSRLGRTGGLPGVKGNPCPALALSAVDFGDLLAESVTGFPIHLRGFDALDAAPALAGLGGDLAHLLDGMMFSAVVAIRGFGSHGGLLSRLPPRRGRRYITRDAALNGFNRLAGVVPGHVAAGNLATYRQVGE